MSKPTIRFKEYTDDWEQRKFSDEIKLVGGATPSKSNSKYWNGDIVWLSSQEIKNKYVMEGTYKITQKAIDNNTTKLVESGTPLIVTRSGILAKRFPISIPMQRVAINQDIKALNFKNKMNTEFFVAQLISKEYFILSSIVKTGTTVQSVNIPDLEKMLICIPTFKEQEKIGSFFKQLDDTIALHQRKLELLKEQKKGFLQKMFPKSGQKVPEIRFEGFTDDWEQCKLKDYVGPVISDGDWIEKEHIHDFGVYRIIQTGNLGIGEFHDKSSSAKYMNEESFNILKANEIFPNDILISRLADPAGRTIILPDTKNKMVTAVDVTIIRPNNLFDSYFFITEMNSSIVLNKISKSVSGTSHKRISRKNLELILLLIPSLEEQQKIGLFFKQLDNTIALHQRKLDKLKQTKQAFLQKMFV